MSKLQAVRRVAWAVAALALTWGGARAQDPAQAPVKSTPERGAAPTPPPPAPPHELGEVRVVEQTPGTRTIVDSAGRRHVVMRKITPADRKAAAARARATREARRARDAQQSRNAESSQLNAASDKGAIQ